MRHMAHPVAHENEIVGASRRPYDIAIFEAAIIFRGMFTLNDER
jgi:hypothetical protein